MKRPSCRQSVIPFFILCVTMASLLMVGCQSKDSAQTEEVLARPVSYMTLREHNPARDSLSAGSVVSWKEETIGFDVSGRIEFVMDQGTNVQGPILDGDGNLVNPGTVVARLENKRYAEEINEARAEIQATEARMLRAKADYGRQVEVYEKGAGAKSYVDKAEAEYKAALAALRAARSNLTQTQIDEADTLLLAPYNGLVARVNSTRGAYVERGAPVARIQMMDPIKVEFAVAPVIEERLNYNDLVRLYLAGSQEPIDGYVYNKAPMADTSTRTFRVTLMVRNRLVDVGLPADVDPDAIVRTPELPAMESLHNNGRAPWVVSVDSLFKDETGYYVWKVQDLKIEDLAGDYNPVFQVTKARITPGDRYFDYAQIFTFREVVDLGDFNPATDLMTGALSREVQEGDQVALVHQRWLLRPGQIVRADFQYGLLNPGFYVSVEAVMKEGGTFHVFKVEDKDETTQQAVQVVVETGNTIGTHIEINPVQANQLSVGDRIVVDGAAYLRDGDPINAFIEVEDKL